MKNSPASSFKDASNEKNDVYFLQKPNTDTESVATLCSSAINGNEIRIIDRNFSTKTIVPSSAGHNMLKKQQLYRMDSPKLVDKGTKRAAQHSPDVLSSGKTAVSKNAFSNGIRNISDISLFGLPGNYKVSVSSNSKSLTDSFCRDADQYNISSPGIDCSDIYEDISFESDCSNNNNSYQNGDKNLSNSRYRKTSLLMREEGNVLLSTPDTTLHEKKLLNHNANNTDRYRDITDILKCVRKELLFHNESKNEHNTTIFGQDLKKKDYYLSDSDKIKHILNYEMGYENNFISEKILLMEKSLFDLQKNLRSSSSYINCYISSFFCPTVSSNYFLLKENIRIAKKNPWCLFDERFWMDYEKEENLVSKSALVAYPDDEEDFKKNDDEFKGYIKEKQEELLDQEYELQTLKIKK